MLRESLQVLKQLSWNSKQSQLLLFVSSLCVVGRWALGKGSIHCLKGSPYNLAPGVMMLGLSQRYWTREGLKSLAMLVVIMRVCGGASGRRDEEECLIWRSLKRMTFLLGNGIMSSTLLFVISLQSISKYCKTTILDGAVPSSESGWASLES